MFTCLLVLIISLQDTSIADNSKSVFSRLTRVACIENNLRIESAVTQEELKAGFEDLWKRLDVGIGVCQSSLGISSIGGDSHGNRAIIEFQPSGKRRTFSWTYVDDRNGRLFHLQQGENGEIRFQSLRSASSVSMTQTVDGNCVLYIHMEGTSKKWAARNFKALLRDCGKEGVLNLLAELEEFLGSAPLSPYSKEVIEKVVRTKSLARSEKEQMEKYIEEVGKGSVEERGRALGQLRQLGEESPSFGVAFILRTRNEGDLEVRKQLESVLKTDSITMRITRMIAEDGLYNDLDYLISLYNDMPVSRDLLSALTGQRFKMKEEWLDWYKKRGKMLVWDAASWTFK